MIVDFFIQELCDNACVLLQNSKQKNAFPGRLQIKVVKF